MSLQDKPTQSKPGGVRQLLLMGAGFVAIVTGLIGSGTGSAWSPPVYAFLFGFKWVESIDSFMPYFPLVPFYPLFLIMLGAFLMVKSRR